MLTDLLIPSYLQLLGALGGWLEKARAQTDCGECRELMAARLAPDMYPLATQVRFACVQVYEGVARLRDEALPDMVDVLLDEGRNASEDPGSLDDALTRIAGATAMLKSLAADALDRDALDPIAHDLPNGMVFDFTAEQYARDWTLSQFYFHVMIAYAIMRKEGIELGKGDYVGHLLPFLRPCTIPTG
jgi:hypothetical protein